MSARTSVSKQTQKKRVKKKPRGKPFEPGNKIGHRFKPGESGNPGGKPKLLSDAYKEWLAEEDENGITNAAHVARSIGSNAKNGSVPAAHEIKSATEGDKLQATIDDGLTDDQRLARITAILDAARARRDRQTDGDNAA